MSAARLRWPGRAGRLASSLLALVVGATAWAQDGTGTAATSAAGTPAASPSSEAALGSGLSLPGLGTPLGTIGAPRLSYGVRSELTLSDNLRHRRSDQARSDARLEVTPYVMASSERPRARYQLSYQMRNFAYARDDRDQLFRHNLSGDGSFALAGDKLWVDVRAFMGSVADDISGDLSDDPLSSFSNFSRYRTFTISPWYQDRIGSLATYQLRYSHTRSSGSQSLNYAESNQSASAIVDGIDRGTAWNWRWFGSFQRNDFRGGFERDRRHSGVTVFYRVGHRLRLSGGLEYEQIDGVRNDDGDDYGWGPSFGFDWNPNARLSLSANIAERFYGTTGSARLAWTLARSTLGVQYHRLMMSSADGSLLAMDPGAMTSNPIGRPNTIIGDLLSRGILLPEGLRLSPSFLTDAAVLENRLTAFWALAGAGRSLTLSLYLSNRETRAEIPGLNTGGGIRGSAGLSSTGFSGEVEERGAVLGYQQSLGARSQLSASIARRYVESPTADFENQLTTVQAGLSSRIDRGTTVFGGLRHSTQSTRGRSTATPYDENAIYGGVDFRFR